MLKKQPAFLLAPQAQGRYSDEGKVETANKYMQAAV